MTYQIDGGNNFNGQSEAIAHFGVNKPEDVIVKFPNGEEVLIKNVPVNSLVLLN